MKKIVCSLALLVAAIGSLSAQTVISLPTNPPASTPPNISNPPISTPPNTDNPPTPPPPSSNFPPSTPAPIGTILQPATVGEYCTFLTDTLAPEQEPSLEAVQADFGITSDGPIICDGSMNNYNFSWDLNRTGEIITTVPSAEVQQLFNNWRSNPYSQELLDYMMDVYHTDPRSVGSKIGGNHTTYAPTNILELYPNSTTLPKARSLAIYPAAGNYLLYNERGISVIDPRSPINPRYFISVGRYQVPQPDYHRPIAIGPAL